MKKRFINILIMLVIILITLEFSPYVISPILYNHKFDADKLRSELLAIIDSTLNTGDSLTDNGNLYLGHYVIHPYLGFVNENESPYNEYGFPEKSPLIKKDSQSLNICIMGGSVAMGLYHFSREQLQSTLQKATQFKNKNFNIRILALPGYKQPQQLMTLNYLLALGAEYDIIINLDGFNDIVLPYSDNMLYGVFGAFPRGWSIFAKKGMQREVQLIVAKQLKLEEDWKEFCDNFVQNNFHKSRLGLIIWESKNLKIKGEQFESENELKDAMAAADNGFQITGPFESVSDTSAFFEKQARIWARTSRLMNSICFANNIGYYHFLQPNQYVPSSKKFSEEELLSGYEQTMIPYKKAVLEGYNYLIEEGKSLKSEGVNYLDLTMVFKNEAKTVYIDKCCHLNKYGYDILATIIADNIIAKSNSKNTK